MWQIINCKFHCSHTIHCNLNKYVVHYTLSLWHLSPSHPHAVSRVLTQFIYLPVPFCLSSPLPLDTVKPSASANPGRSWIPGHVHSLCQKACPSLWRLSQPAESTTLCQLLIQTLGTALHTGVYLCLWAPASPFLFTLWLASDTHGRQTKWQTEDSLTFASFGCLSRSNMARSYDGYHTTARSYGEANASFWAFASYLHEITLHLFPLWEFQACMQWNMIIPIPTFPSHFPRPHTNTSHSQGLSLFKFLTKSHSAARNSADFCCCWVVEAFIYFG